VGSVVSESHSNHVFGGAKEDFVTETFCLVVQNWASMSPSVTETVCLVVQKWTSKSARLQQPCVWRAKVDIESARVTETVYLVMQK
jgi:hypothetical protein